MYLHYVSKNVPPLTCYNRYIHGSIATIFGTNVAEKYTIKMYMYFIFPPYLTSVVLLHYLGKQETRKLLLFT